MFISSAYAQAAGGQGGLDLMGLMPLVLLFVLLYFLMIRPQAKKQKEHKTMLQGLQKGDEVLSAGGVLGTVVSVYSWPVIMISQLSYTLERPKKIPKVLFKILLHN